MDDCGGCFAFLIGLAFVNYVSHFITLMIMRWRHAGKICSGDYYDGYDELDFGRYSLFGATIPENEYNYIHQTGMFLWYAIQSQFFFILVMISGGTFYAGMESGY